MPVPYASPMAIRVGVVGAGSWGTTIASMAALNTTTMLWARNASTAQVINSEHRNPAYLGKRALPAELVASHDLEEVVRFPRKAFAKCFMLQHFTYGHRSPS